MSVPILCPMSLTSFYDPFDGAVLSASLYYYHAGTLDPLTVYSDPSLQRIWAQPVLTGGSGRVPPVWVDLIDEAQDKNRYRVRSFDQYGTLLEDIDNLPGGLADPVDQAEVPPTSGTLPPVPSAMNAAIFHTGDITMAWNIALPGKEGWLRCNGGTIGRTSGSEGSGDTVMALYFHLWNNDPDFLLHVQGGTAQGSWDLGTTIQLPDFRSRVPVGMDSMGSGDQTFPFRMEGAKLSETKGGVLGHLGANGGVANHVLVIDNLPNDFTPTVKDDGHTHILVDPQHGHPVYDPQHQHSRATWKHASDNNDTTGGANPVGADALGQTGPTMYTDYNYSGVSLYAQPTGITIDAATGGKQKTGITILPFGKSTPFSLAQPFITVAFYIHL